MKLAVFGDIYANRIALETAVRFADHLGADVFVFLGNYITRGYDPHGTIEIIRRCMAEKRCFCIRSHAEKRFLRDALTAGNISCVNGMQHDFAKFTLNSLTQEDIDFLKSLPDETEILLPGLPSIRCCAIMNEGAPLILPGSKALETSMRECGSKLLLTCIPMQFRYEMKGRQVISPGTIGMHNRGICKSQFTLMTSEDDRWSLRMMNMEYDRIQAVQEFDRTSLPAEGGVYAQALRRALMLGDNILDDCMKKVMEITRTNSAYKAQERAWRIAYDEIMMKKR